MLGQHDDVVSVVVPLAHLDVELALLLLEHHDLLLDLGPLLFGDQLHRLPRRLDPVLLGPLRLLHALRRGVPPGRRLGGGVGACWEIVHVGPLVVGVVVAEAAVQQHGVPDLADAVVDEARGLDEFVVVDLALLAPPQQVDDAVGLLRKVGHHSRGEQPHGLEDALGVQPRLVVVHL